MSIQQSSLLKLLNNNISIYNKDENYVFDHKYNLIKRAPNARSITESSIVLSQVCCIIRKFCLGLNNIKEVDIATWNTLKKNIVILYEKDENKNRIDSKIFTQAVQDIERIITTLDPFIAIESLLTKEAKNFTEQEIDHLHSILLLISGEKLTLRNIFLSCAATYWKYLLIEEFDEKGGATKSYGKGFRCIDWKKIDNLTAEETTISLALEKVIFWGIKRLIQLCTASLKNKIYCILLQKGYCAYGNYILLSARYAIFKLFFWKYLKYMV